MRTYDPKMFPAVGGGAIMPIWERFGGKQAQVGVLQRVEDQMNETVMESVLLDQKEQCAYLNSISVEIQGFGKGE